MLTLEGKSEETIFNYIAKNIVGIPDNPFHQTGKNMMLVFLFTSFHNKNNNNNKSGNSKFHFALSTIENPFFTIAQRIQFLECFCKIQRTRFALSRLAYIYKLRKANVVVDTDLGLNPIDPRKSDVLCILQDSSKYFFRINDLINIMQNALSHSYHFFAEPLVIKNPYNNIPFNKSTLYNIYFSIRFQSLVLPDLIHKFFLTNFNLTAFRNTYEHIIREHVIHDFVKSSSSETLEQYVFNMLDDTHTRLDIDREFPVNLLVNIMKPYLLLYITSTHSLIMMNKSRAHAVLRTKLRQFEDFNPAFGRKIIMSKKTFSYKKNKFVTTRVVEFNTKHIEFNNEDDKRLISRDELREKIKVNLFLSSHLHL